MNPNNVPAENLTETTGRIAKAATTKARRRHAGELAQRHATGQLAFWPDNERGIPNEFVRCALFAARNRKDPRGYYTARAPLKLQIIGGGCILYVGDELRQDDESVFLQLVHMAKEARSPIVTFTGQSMLKAIGWPIKGESYDRLVVTIRRLTAGLLEVHSPRLGDRVSTRLIAKYYAAGEDSEAGPGNAPWKVRVFDQDDPWLLLFENLYSRLEWETRLALPDGIATWLHGFYSSHREPFPHKLETLAAGAGLRLEHPDDAILEEGQREAKHKERLREAKKSVRKGLDTLVRVGFLESFSISRLGIVEVVRAPGR